MQAFTTLNGLVAPLDRSNVDTDAIIPKQFLKSIHRTGFGPNLFDSWRYLDTGEPEQDCRGRPLRQDFVLNLPRYQGAQILLARDNFGCGSSREHAVWALYEYGFRCVIAPSYGDIFATNAGKNGLLTIVLDLAQVEQLFREVEQTKGYRLQVNLRAQTVAAPTGQVFGFEIEAALKERLLLGQDDIGMTLERRDLIRAYEQRRLQERPWLFPDLT
ncbi:MAG: 3-isopropylmalate dehydratase small subunit [Gammaproteobacteria bacterium]|nr:3-isopropylmalate dehydratase small subunit [Gammaproteobacteria bacterium]MCY4210269.1 3-isopropylmalate dehydratase small subunit [Gammaproteobacteria bacterium]MCY4281544.1 3-isopropylmalate dehydratase small subunit [Gammaproteobacteria bacterium]MCY4338760.1 3-isopropylmalate dehydratase small subunit [Gammaproteobacteria bacterium]